MNFNARKVVSNGTNYNELKAYEDETVAFCLPVRCYGTCGNMTPYVPSPTSQHNRYRKYQTHVVAEHETLAGIALRYDITVEDIRRTNSFLWTSNSVWVGQVIKVPVFDQHARGSTEDQLNTHHEKHRRRSSGAAAAVKVGPSASEFWTKVDSSIEESRRVTKELKKHSEEQPLPAKETNDLNC